MGGGFWTQLLYALPLIIMLFILWPRAKHMIANSPKGTASEWRSALLPLAAVVGFVILLIMSV
jgi:hypothetical protein